MKRFWNIVLCVLTVVPLIAQEDYFFTLLDHWNWKGPDTYVPTNLKKCAVSLCAAEDVDFTFSTPVNNGQTTIHVNRGNNSVVMIDDVDAAILNGVSIHSTGASSVNINIIGTTSAAETAVLPKRLLGTKYMVQGAPGLLVDNLPVYSQFSIVGTEYESSISVKPRVAMTCVTTGENIPAGQVSNFQIDKKQVLLFQPVNYEDEISGTIVESDRKIAVFQGNTITRIPVTAGWSDFVYEQACPISSWGKEFIIPKASGLITCDWKIVAAENNTEVYIYADGRKVKHGVINAGEWFTETIYSASSDYLQVSHVETSKPVCCYLYMTGSSLNNDKGDPEMIEIVPVDKMAKTARWGKAQTNDNTPHTISLLVTAPLADETKVQYNGQPLSTYATQSGVKRVVIDGFVVYQIPFTTANGVLRSTGEGFSAHIIHYAKTAEGTGYNVSLPEEMPERTDLCMDGTLLFREDFGGNDVNDPVAGTNPVIGMTSAYTQIYDTASCMGGWSPCVGMGSGRYLLTKTGYRNSTAGYNYSHWFKMDDHTYPNDYTRGYLLEVDGSVDNATLYEAVIDGLCEGSTLTFSAYVANITISFSYDQSGNTGDPELSFILQDPETGIALAPPYNTGPIPVDRSYQDEAVSLEWRHSAQWHLVGTNFEVPSGKTAVKLTIKNACTSNNGNDFALDDIEIRLCAPPVTIDGEAEVCEGETAMLTAKFENDGTLAEPLEYKWWFSPDSITWTERTQTSSRLSVVVGEQTAGWYQVAVAGAGNIERVNCRAQSEPFKLTVKECESHDLCTDGILLFREDFGGNTPYFSRVGQTPVAGMSYIQVKTDDKYTSMSAGKYIVTKSGYCNGDTTGWTLPESSKSKYRSQWYIQDDHTYPNDYTLGYFMEIDGNGGNQQFYETEINGLCEGIELTFSAYVANVFTWFQYDWYTKNKGPVIAPNLMFVLTNPTDGSVLASKETGDIPFDENLPALTDWQYSSEWHLVGMNFTVPVGVKTIRLSIYNNVTNGNGNDFAIDDIEIHLCRTAEVYTNDTTVCDTVSKIQWRGRTYEPAEVLRDTLSGSCGFDSIYYILNVETERCEPPGPELYPLIVNKYNWVLLMDNVTFARLFPDRYARALQWYRNGEPIPGANEDDYSEHNELNGRFQLRLELDDDRTIWSNILEINTEAVIEPVQVFIYDSRGVPVKEHQVTHGIYLYRYKQGDQVWTEKKLIP